MAVRQYVINGECMTWVRGRGSLLDLNDDSGPAIPANMKFVELGLTSDQVNISILMNHQDVLVDDFGPKVPAEVLVQQAEARIKFTLIHYDPVILQACLSESLGGSYDNLVNPNREVNMPRPERLFSAGMPLGGGQPVLYPRCHYIQLLLTSPVLGAPWLFPSTYVMEEVKIPTGTSTTIASMTWRSIPYKSQYTFSDPLNASSGFNGATSQEINASGSLIYNAYNQYLFFKYTSGGTTIPLNVNYSTFSGFGT